MRYAVFEVSFSGQSFIVFIHAVMVGFWRKFALQSSKLLISKKFRTLRFRKRFPMAFVA